MVVVSIEFQGLKFWKTEYRFKNNKECAKHFDDALKSGVEMYKGELKRYMNENLHILYSLFWTFRVLTVACLAGSLFPSSEITRWLMLGMGIASGIATLIYWKVADNYSDRMMVTEAFNDTMDEALYQVREDLLKENEEKTQ